MNAWLVGIAEAIKDAEDGDWEDMARAVAERIRDVTDEMECAGEGLEGREAWDAMILEALS